MTLAMQTKKELLASKIALKRRLTNEERLQRELSKFFKKLHKEVQSALQEYWSEYQMLQGHINLICAPVHEAHKEYYEILKKYKLREYELGKREAKRLVDRAGVRYAFKEAKSMPINGFIKKNSNELFGTLPKAEQDLLNRTFKTSEKTLSRVDSQLNQIITDGYRSGKGINDISNQITRRFDQLESWEAKRIARTEVNTAHNKATIDTYNEMGVEYTQWIAASDDRTRDSHVEVDGEIIPMGATYSNGLAYPGDMSGPIEEWINCRCSNAPFVIPYGYLAPSFSPFREEDLVPIENVRTADEILNQQQPVESIQEEMVKTSSFKENGATYEVYNYKGTEIAISEQSNFTPEEIQKHIDSLPKIMKDNLDKLERMTIHHYNSDVGGNFYPETNTINVYSHSNKTHQYNIINHELGHFIDSIMEKTPYHYYYSNPKVYEKIFKADNELKAYTTPRGKKRVPNRIVTKYASSKYVSYNKEFNKVKKMWEKNELFRKHNPTPYNKKFVEDFAESTMSYLNPYLHESFVKTYPNRAKLMKEIYGEPVFDKSSEFYKLTYDNINYIEEQINWRPKNV